MNERVTTRSDYALRLERVFRWLADHLDDTLNLAQLADVAAMSPYRFHRIYHAMQCGGNQCSMLNGQCSMANAQWPMRNAQCKMRNAEVGGGSIISGDET